MLFLVKSAQPVNSRLIFTSRRPASDVLPRSVMFFFYFFVYMYLRTESIRQKLFRTLYS